MRERLLRRLEIVSRRASRGQLDFRHGARVGSAPGQYQIDPEAARTRISVIAYGPAEIEEHGVENVADVDALLDRYPVTWVNVDGLGDAATIATVGEYFELHPLALEDVVHVPQRAKTEDYADQMFVIVHMAHPSEVAPTSIGLEQLSMIFGQGYVVTFQEQPGDCFEGVRQRLREGRARIRSAGADYLAYALLDAAIDSLFPLLEVLDERLMDLEESATSRFDGAVASQLKEMKRAVHLLYRTVYPERDAVLRLQRDTGGLIAEETKLYLRDVHDHASQAIDLLQDARELARDLTDLHHAALSNRLNDVMKFLTIFATIFIPLGFVAGLYGMNFDPEVSRWNMPELGWAYGYPFALSLMAAVAFGMLGFFWFKGWLWSDD
jgi:magnesium transporter